MKNLLNQLNNRSSILLQFVCLLCVLSLSATVNSAVTSLRVSPSNKLIIKNQDSTINARWQIATNPSHSSGITSTSARIINPLTGTVLGVTGAVLSAAGSGPFNFNETISLPTVDTDLWFAQGLKSVVLKRTFSDPAGGSGRDVQLTLQLSSSSLSARRESVSGELNILGLNFEFENGTVLTQIDQKEHLQGTLTLNYTGAGLLEGRWQLAEPAGSYDEPLYRTLALVKKNISANQRSMIKSPTLPSLNTGKYLVRFCVTNRNMRSENNQSNEVCPITNLIVNAAYQVRGQKPTIKLIGGIQPNQQVVGKQTPFSWNSLPNATVYQLQIFELVSTKASLASSRDSHETVQPEFVTGMMLQGNTTSSALSELVVNKLQNGKNYLWRVTAHNQMGHVVGGSNEATFTYQEEGAN